MKEQWYTIPEDLFPHLKGRYEVSNTGKIARKGYVTTVTWKKQKVNRTYPRRARKPGFVGPKNSKYGQYVGVVFIVDGKQYAHTLHRLVWMSCVGAIPPHLEMDHVDHNKMNNALTNLQLVTSRTNALLREAAGHGRQAKGTK